MRTVFKALLKTVNTFVSEPWSLSYWQSVYFLSMAPGPHISFLQVLLLSFEYPSSVGGSPGVSMENPLKTAVVTLQNGCVWALAP